MSVVAYTVIQINYYSALGFQDLLALSTSAWIFSVQVLCMKLPVFRKRQHANLFHSALAKLLNYTSIPIINSTFSIGVASDCFKGAAITHKYNALVSGKVIVK